MKYLILGAPFVLAACGSVEPVTEIEAYIEAEPVAAIEAVEEKVSESVDTKPEV